MEFVQLAVLLLPMFILMGLGLNIFLAMGISCALTIFIFDLPKMIPSPPLEDARQPIHTDPDKIGCPFNAEQPVGVDMRVKETDPFCFHDHIGERMASIVPEHRFAAAEIHFAKTPGPSILQCGNYFIPGHIRPAGIGNMAASAGKVAAIGQ